MAQHSASFSRNHQGFLPTPAEWPPSFICCPPGEQPSALPLSDLIVQSRMTCFHLHRPPGSAHLTLTVRLCTGCKAGALVFLLRPEWLQLDVSLEVVAAAAPCERWGLLNSGGESESGGGTFSCLSDWPAGSALTPDDPLVDLAPDTLGNWKQVCLAN